MWEEHVPVAVVVPTAPTLPPAEATHNIIDDDIYFAQNRAEDIARVRNEGFEVDDDNDPAPENIPAPAEAPPVVNEGGLYEGQTWGWDGIDHRQMAGGGYDEPSFTQDFTPIGKTYLQLFMHFFLMTWFSAVLLPETNAGVVNTGTTPVTFGELLRFLRRIVDDEHAVHARGLRAILRQDPDVIMLGEIRDQETAQIAVQASLTGHLVLSTLHTNSAVGAVTRLVDMGVDAYLLASSLVGILSQRLLRTLCPHCKASYRADAVTCERLGINAAAPPSLFRAVGCEQCQHGYRGRIGIYELLSVTPTVAALIHQGAGEQALLDETRRVSRSLFQDGRQRVLDGVTSLDELLRVTRED